MKSFWVATRSWHSLLRYSRSVSNQRPIFTSVGRPICRQLHASRAAFDEWWRPWSQDEIESFTRLRDNGASIAEITRQLGRPPSYIKSLLRHKSDAGVLPSGYKHYTAEETSRLLLMKAEGRTLGYMAESLGKSKKSVGEKLRRLERPKAEYARPWTHEDEAVLMSMKQSGRTYADIATALKRTKLAVSSQYTRMKRGTNALTSRAKIVKRKYSPEEDQRLMDLRSAGHNFEQIARLMPERSRSSLRKRVRTLAVSASDGVPARAGRVWTVQDKGLLENLYRQGLPWREIAKQLGRSYWAVDYAINQSLGPKASQPRTKIDGGDRQDKP